MLHKLPSPHPATTASAHLFRSLSSYQRTTLLTLSHDDVLHTCITAAFWLSTIVYIAVEVTGNVSQADRLWTLIPVVSSAIVTFFPLWGHHPLPNATIVEGLDDRMLLVLLCQLLWSIRLTVHTYRRGYYSLSAEDYRYVILKKSTPYWQWKLLCLVYISFGQVFLLALPCLIQYLLLTTRLYPPLVQTPLGLFDFAIVVIFCSILVIEQIADNQQQQYQDWKRSVAAQTSTNPRVKAAVERGFITSGLWSWSRHPNCACEQLTWWAWYLFTLITTLPWQMIATNMTILVQRRDWFGLAGLFQNVLYRCINYSMIGPVILTLLLHASSSLTEKISSSKYPLYKDYQITTDMFSPPLTMLRYIVLTILGKRRELYRKVYGDTSKYDSHKNRIKKD